MDELLSDMIPDPGGVWRDASSAARPGDGILHCYLLARLFCRDKDVLDMTQGDTTQRDMTHGWEMGSALLASRAREVVRPGAGIRPADLPDASRDVVIAFGVIGASPDPEARVAEARRVLRPEGVLILDMLTRRSGTAGEASHGVPLTGPPKTGAELRALLSGGFRHVLIHAQRPVHGIAMAAEAPFTGTAGMVTFERREGRYLEHAGGLPDPFRLVAIASDAPIEGYFDSFLLTSGLLTSGPVPSDGAILAARHDHRLSLEARAQTAREYARAEDEWRAMLEKKDEDILRLGMDAARYRRERDLIRNSTLWRLTRPLRAMGERHPMLRRLTALPWRGKKRVAPGQEPAPEQSPERSIAAHGTRCSPPSRVSPAMRRWFFLGGTIDRARGHAAGVDRIAIRLYRAAREEGTRRPALPCVLGKTVSGLALLPPAALACFGMAETEPRAAPGAYDPPPAGTPAAPAPGDHVFFTGAVWTDARVALFHALTEQGIRFSVLVHDTIPLRRPDRAGAADARQFAAWLAIVLALAETVFALGASVEDDILRWVALTGNRTAARIARMDRPVTWSSAWDAMARAQEGDGGAAGEGGTAWREAADLADGPRPPDFPGAAAFAIPDALALAREWCVADDPEVSILIVNWNAGALTLECIRQIWANTAGARYEIIVVDNGGAAEDLAPLRSLGRGARLFPLGINRYFGEANNIAAAHARGRYVCFLNNDAFARPGWLRALTRCLEDDPSAGAAGPLFLFPNGTIQEAGGMIGTDGVPVRFGRFLPPDEAHAHLSPKTVDYVSAATLLMPRDLFLATGGFDLAFEPAYYEDVDLCFKIRAKGFAVRFCPDARVVHVEGASANADPAARRRREATADLNRVKFIARWGDYLNNRDATVLRAAADRVSINPMPALPGPLLVRPLVRSLVRPLIRPLVRP